MLIDDAQRDMRFGYLSGAPGMLVSATVWLVAGLVAMQATPERSVLVLFAGGMLIHPLGVALTKLLGRPGAHRRDNPLGRLALEGTVWFLMTLPVAFLLSRVGMPWFFPAMLLFIGGRYLTFATLYGLRTYWACGASLAIAGMLVVAMKGTPVLGAFAGAAIEYAFGAMLLFGARAGELIAVAANDAVATRAADR